MDEAAGQEVKGLNLIGLVKLLKSRGWFDRVVAALPPDDQQGLAQRLLATSWYPYPLFARLLQTIDQQAGGGHGRLAFEMGIFAAEQQLKGSYQSLVTSFRADFSAVQASLIWKSFYRPGRWIVDHSLQDGRQICRMELSGFRPVPTHCSNIAGWLHGYFDLAGCQDVQVEKVACVTEGDEACVFLVGYSPQT